MPGHPVFYGALDAHTAMEEIRKNGIDPIEEGDIIFLSEWRLKQGSQISLKYLTLPEINEDNQLYSSLTKKVYKELAEMFASLGSIHVKFQLSLFEKISRLFLGSNYLQSSIVAYDVMFNTILEAPFKIDGLIYPSCSNNFRSVNCALRPDFVDDNLELVEVKKYTFKQYTENAAVVSSMYVGKCNHNKIIWTVKVSELLKDKFEVIYYADHLWDNKKITEALFINDGDECDLDLFCKESIKEIDTTKDIKVKEGYTVDLEKDICAIYEIPIKRGKTYFLSDSEKNPISTINIVIPFKTTLEEVSPEEVLKS